MGGAFAGDGMAAVVVNGDAVALEPESIDEAIQEYGSDVVRESLTESLTAGLLALLA